jgi:hypothetical protein
MKMMPIADPSAEITSGYLLVDASNYPRSLDCEPLPICRCIPADLTNIADLLPGLIDIGVLDAHQLQIVREILVLQTAGKHAWTICGVLRTDVGIEKLAEHIGGLLSVIDDEDRHVLWRFFDPRVFSLMISTFSIQQKATLLGPIREWCFAWRQRWWTVMGDVTKCVRPFDFDVELPTREQWPILRLSRLIDQVLLQLERESPMTSVDCLRAQQSTIIYLTEASAELNLTEAEDLIDFAYLGMKYGAALRSDLNLIGAKANLASGKLSWSVFRNAFNSVYSQDFEKGSSSITRG